MRTRFTVATLAALAVLAAGALGIAITLAATEAAVWPAWLRPYHRYGWWSVVVLLAAGGVLAFWQATRQPGSPTVAAGSSVQGNDSGPIAGRDVSASGGFGPTAGRDLHTLTGSSAPTAGRDIITTSINVTASPPASDPARPTEPAEGGVESALIAATLPTVEDDLRALEELKPLIHESVYVKFQERILFRRFPHLGS